MSLKKEKLTPTQLDNIKRYMPHLLDGSADPSKTKKGKPVMTLSMIIEEMPPVREVRRFFKKKALEYESEESFSE
jgi:hypothetical protein